MRAIRQERVGGPEVLEEVEVDRPVPIPTEVLVRVHAAGINPVDWKTRDGNGIGLQPPFTLGWDVSGVVAELGFGTSIFAVGDEVLGMPWFPRPANAYAEYVTAPARHFVRKPARLSHAEAAGLPLAGLTAWQAIVDVADIQPGQRVLVTAAAGGVGHLAVQIAKARGAYVLGTARAAKHDFLRSLGVDEPIDYTTVDIPATVRDVDVVLDLVGGEHSVGLVRTLSQGGLIIPVPGGVSADVAAAAARHGVRTSPILVEPDHAGLLALVDLIEADQLKVVVEQTFPLADAGKAHEVGEGGRVVGKLVLTV
ncbi:MAG TPA: NADP-dependent oxidoreductase [Pseudonocardiaceae bacterium]|jgi:NADPH:quinone reductase-like Zn-dependent oxidoreductase|nr:NADP-dependent oxidoreductase [Pseudonocardiaceae bacterium]